jgi:hypothetical protein
VPASLQLCHCATCGTILRFVGERQIPDKPFVCGVFPLFGAAAQFGILIALRDQAENNFTKDFLWQKF